MSSDKTLHQKIAADIEKSGFPLEIEVTSSLLADEWSVRNQAYYLDKEEEKGRTIDVVASKTYVEDFVGHNLLEVNLIIECKRSKKPWVFFIAPLMEDRFNIAPVTSFKYFAANKNIKEQLIQWQLGELHYSSPPGKAYAVAHYEPFTKGEGRRISEAEFQVIKALKYELDHSEIYRKLASNVFAIRLFFPIIVFDGDLCACRLENGSLRVLSSDRLVYSVEHGDRFLVDVVRRQHFAQYIKIIYKDIESIIRAAKKKTVS